MDSTKSLSLTRRGVWIIIISKHLLNYRSTDPRLSALENVIFAGKCGSLLIKITADDSEKLNRKKIEGHARLCGILSHELNPYLQTIKEFGCIDWNTKATTYEVLAFSRERVLITTAKILESIVECDIAKVLPEILEFCLLRPRLASEMKMFASTVLKDKDTIHCLEIIRIFDLLGVIDIPGKKEMLYYNGYQFGDKAIDIGRALLSLGEQERIELNMLLEEVNQKPGRLPEDLDISEKIMNMAVGLGLVEVSEVASSVGNAKFLTIPQLAPPSIGQETSHLEDDVFNHAKMLLSSLRFGELKSSWYRGRIAHPPVLIKSLLDRDRVGPCTAIGEDYVILEGEGVIRTIPARDRPGNQFYMELRRREPAEIVLGLLKSGKSAKLDARSLPNSLQLPLTYIGPESSRLIAAKKVLTKDAECIRHFLEEIRT